PAARHALHRFVERLEQTAEPAAGGLAWRAAGDAPLFVLGRAHGIAGVLAPLADAMRAGIEVERCRRLIAGAVRFLLASCPASASQPRFPFALADGTPCHVDRFGWCTGDPGIADSLVIAGRILGDRAVVEAARANAVDAARLAMQRTGDASSLCCGVAGRALLFARLARELNEPALGMAAAHERSKLTDARDVND